MKRWWVVTSNAGREFKNDSEKGRIGSRTDVFLEYRRSHHELAKQHDDRLLWAAGGLFAASVTLLTAAWTSGISVPISPLLGSWTCLGLALVTVLMNFQLAMECEQRNMDFEERRPYAGFWTSKRLLVWTGLLNRAALGLFVAAAILFLVSTSMSARGESSGARTQATPAATSASAKSKSDTASRGASERSPREKGASASASAAPAEPVVHE